MMIERIIRRVTGEIATLPFVEGIVLGGSRATGTATESSDVDIGIYYDPAKMNFARMNLIAEKLDDEHRKDLICGEGGWGPWVNCGGWLRMDGVHVDFILRDINRVSAIVQDCERGVVSSHYQTGHPHAYISAMYRGELAVSKILYARTEEFQNLKQSAESYPDALQSAILSLFLFEAQFSCALAENYADTDDVYYVAGHLFRSVSALNQVLFALNRVYCLNEKRAVLRIETLPVRPLGYAEAVNRIFRFTDGSLGDSVKALKQLCGEVKKMCDEHLQ